MMQCEHSEQAYHRGRRDAWDQRVGDYTPDDLPCGCDWCHVAYWQGVRDGWQERAYAQLLAEREGSPGHTGGQGQPGQGGWIEVKQIKGYRYLYLRWREGGRKRSKYLGKGGQ